ncbi:hypothetical protein J4447_01600 [Candidatus Pacearchaeota archaeon]|nr:hypothetical protein [Candidatus Pacearchaeota archaeon]
MSNIDVDKYVLGELSEIVIALNKSVRHPLIVYAGRKSSEEKHAENLKRLEEAASVMGVKQPWEKLKSRISGRELVPWNDIPARMALNDLNTLTEYSRENNASDYVSGSLEIFTKVLLSMAEADGTTIDTYLEQADDILGLMEACQRNSGRYMNCVKDTPSNVCRGEIYNAGAAIGKLEEAVGMYRGVGEAEVADRISKLADMGRSYLDLCRTCPFMKLGDLKRKEAKERE